ncbi:MAG: hypothetical protein ACF8PN_14480 [Phycisphaerales bacterium]
MSGIDARRRWSSILSFGAPLAVVAFACLLSGGPSDAVADEEDTEGATASEDVVAVPAVATPRNDAYLESLAHARRVREEPVGDSPFYFAEPTEIPTPNLIDPTAELSGRPPIIVQAIMKGTRPLALINGEPMRVGDSIVEGWTVRSIDPESRTVVIEGPDGKTETATVGN